MISCTNEGMLDLFAFNRKAERNNLCYLKGVEEQLTVHAHLPAQALKRMGHPNKDDVVDAKHQNQHKGGFGQFPMRRIHELYMCDTCHVQQ